MQRATPRAPGRDRSARRCRTPKPRSSTSITGAELGRRRRRRDLRPRTAGDERLSEQARRDRATIDDDGWLHTGDIGYVDADGCFFVVDRVKELIKYKGMQIAPAEMEAILLGHPAVADAAVVPLSERGSGRGPESVRRAQGRASRRKRSWPTSRARVAPYKKVRAVEVIDQIPSRRRARSCGACWSSAKPHAPESPERALATSGTACSADLQAFNAECESWSALMGGRAARTSPVPSGGTATLSSGRTRRHHRPHRA